MHRNPRLKLPEDPNLNIWNYYTIMKITPMVMDDFLLILLTIPLTDQSLEMDLYKIYNLPTLHPKLKEFTYQMEGEYLAISKSRLYVAVPTAREIRICEATEGYLCLMNQALYPIEKLEWCTYTLFGPGPKQNKAILCHQYSKTRCQQGTKFGRIPLGSVFIKERENAGQMFAEHPCNRYQATTDNHTCGQWL